MAFGLPQQQTNAMGAVAQPGRSALGMGAVQRPPLSGSVVRRGPNSARMDPLAGQLQAAMMARNQPPPVGVPPPPNPGIGPSNENQMIGSLGGGPVNGMNPNAPPPSPVPDMQGPGADQGSKMGILQNYMGQMGFGGGQNPNGNFGNMAAGGAAALNDYLMKKRQMQQGPQVQPQMAVRPGIGPSQPPNQPPPMTQSRRFGGMMGGANQPTTPWNVG